MLAMIPVDIHVSDTYFIVAHIHYVLFGGSLFTIFAGVYYWFPKMTGRMFDERLGKLHFWLTFVFFNLTFGPMHLIGVEGMPRRVADYAGAVRGLEPVHLAGVASCSGSRRWSSSTTWSSSWRGGPRAAANPWRALTLEWQVSSPPPIFNFDARARPWSAARTSTACPGAVHGIFKPPEEARPKQPAGAQPATEHERREPQHGERSSSSRTRRSAARALIDAMRERARRRATTCASSSSCPQTRPRHGNIDLRRGRARRRPGARRPRAASSWRDEGIDGDGRGRRPGSVQRGHGRRRASSRSTRSSSRRCPAHAVGLAAARPDRAPRARRPGCRSSTSSSTSTREGLPFDVTLVVANQTVAAAGAGRAPQGRLADEGAAPLHRRRPAGAAARATPPRGARAARARCSTSLRRRRHRGRRA